MKHGETLYLGSLELVCGGWWQFYWSPYQPTSAFGWETPETMDRNWSTSHGFLPTGGQIVSTRDFDALAWNISSWWRSSHIRIRLMRPLSSDCWPTMWICFNTWLNTLLRVNMQSWSIRLSSNPWLVTCLRLEKLSLFPLSEARL